MLLHDLDDAPIGEVTNDQLGNGRKRLFVIERSGQRDVRLRQKLSFMFNAPSLGNIFRDTEEICRLTRGVVDRNLLRMHETDALVARLYRFFRDVYDLAAVQGLAIFLDEEFGLRPRPKIVVGLAFERLLRPAEQVFARAIESHEPQRLALLDKQHRGGCCR